VRFAYVYVIISHLMIFMPLFVCIICFYRKSRSVFWTTLAADESDAL